MIDREITPYAKSVANQYPVLTVTGPRQSGKTSLCKKLFPRKKYVSLEDLEERDFALSDPKGFLNRFPEGAILDEIQKAPDLVSYIQGIVDSNKKKNLFVLTGSQNFEISRSVSQSLAGRTAILKLLPFTLAEIKNYGNWTKKNILYQGFYPAIYEEKLKPHEAYGFYTETYTERDIRALINLKNLSLFRKFIRLCAGRVGQILNLNSLANDTGISHTTAREWIGLLEASYIAFLLEPYHTNTSKRLIKSPKLYFYDVGLVSYFLGIYNEKQISTHPLIGSLFENMIVVEMIKKLYNNGIRRNLFFYRDSSENEIDLVIEDAEHLTLIEVKSAETFHSDFFKSFSKFEKNFPDLKTKKILIYAGENSFVRQGTKVFNFLDEWSDI